MYAAAKKARVTAARHTKTILGQSTEGARVTAYVERSGHVQSIDVTYFGETGRASYEFYFVDDEPQLVREQQFKYNAPIFMTPQAAEAELKEEGIVVPAFDDRKTKLIERFYRYEGLRLVELTGPRVTEDGRAWNDNDQANRVRAIGKEMLAEFATR